MQSNRIHNKTNSALFSTNKISTAIKLALLTQTLAGGLAFGQVTYTDTPIGATIAPTAGGTLNADTSTSANVTVTQVDDVSLVNWTQFNTIDDQIIDFTASSSQHVLNFVSGGQSTVAGDITSSGNIYFFNQNGFVFSGTAVVNVGSFFASTHTVVGADVDKIASFNGGGGLALTAGGSNLGDISIASGADFDSTVEGIDFVTKKFASAGDIAATGVLRVYATDTATIELDSGFQIVIGSALPFDNANSDLVSFSGGVVSASNVVIDAQMLGATTSAAVNTTGMTSLTANNLTINTSGDVVLDGIINIDAILDITAADTVDFATNSDVDADTSLSITASGAVTQTAGSTINTAALTVNTTDDNVTLTDGTNALGSLSSSTGSGNISVNDTASLNLAGISTSGNLTINATGGIADTTGVVVVGGVADLTVGTGSAQSITLDNDNDFNDFNATASEGVVTVNDINAIDLETINTVQLNVTAAGAVTQNSVLSIGNVSVTSTGTDSDGNVTLNLANDFDTFSGSGTTVVLNDTDSIDLGVTSATTLTVTADNAGDITDSGAIEVTGTSTFTATDNLVTLDFASNDFGTLVATGSTVTIVDENTVALGAITASALDVTAGTGVTNTGAVVVSGLSDITATTGDIALDFATNDFGVFSGSGATISLNDTNSIDLGATAATTLSVTAANAGDITDSGAIEVTGTSTFTATDNLVTLDFASNDFGTLSATGSTVTIVDENTVALGAITASALDVTAGTGVTNTGAVVVSGLSDITATTGNIALDFATNDFASIAAATTGGTVDITDSGAGGIVLNAITGSDLTVSAVGNITQTAALSFATASVNSSSGDVTLDNVANDFGIFSGSGATISLNDTNSIDLGATAATTLSVTAANAGDITDSGAIEVTGTSTFTATDNLVTLDFASNDFGTLSATGSTVTIVDENTVALGALTASALDVTAGTGVTNTGAVVVSGLSDITATTGDIALDFATNDFGIFSGSGATISLNDTNSIDLGATAATTLSVTAANAGDITDSGAIEVTGTSTFTATDNLVTLDFASNDFGTLVATGSTVTIVDENTVALGAITASALDVTAGTGVTNTGAVVVSGLSDITATTGDIALDFATNDFGIFSGSGATISLNDTNSIDLGATAATTLSVTAANAGDITDSGAIEVTGTSTFTATDNLVTLDFASNDFGTLVATGSTVTIVDENTVALGAITASALDVTAGTGVTNTGAVVVSGLSDITATTGNIALDFATNDFASIAAATTGGTVDITDSGAGGIVLDAITGSDLTVSAVGNITQTAALSFATASVNSSSGDVTLDNVANDFGVFSGSGATISLNDTNSIDLGATAATTLSVTAANAGDITDSGAIEVTGTSTFTATDNLVTLDFASNDFGTLVATGSTVTIVDENTVALGAITASALDVTAGTGVTNTGAVVVSGLSDITATTGDIALDFATNDFGVFSGSGSTISLNDTNSIDLGATAATTLSVTAANAGDITDSGAIEVTGTSTFTATDNLVTLDFASNDFGTLVATGSTVTIVDENTVALGAITASALDVTAGTGVTNTGAVVVSGLSDITATTGDIALDFATNDFGVFSGSGATISLNDTNSIDLGATAATTLSVTAANAGDITDSGAIEVTGTSTFTATDNLVTLDFASNDFGTLSATGSTVTIVDENTVALGAIIASALDVTAGTGVTNTGAVVVSGLSDITATTGDIALDFATNDFASIAAATTGGTVDITDSGAGGIVLDAITGSDLIVSAVGNITQTAALSFATASVNSSSGDVTLDNVANDFGIFSGSGATISLNDTNSIDLGATAATTLSVTAANAGDITDSGAIEVTGTSTFTATDNLVTLDFASNDFGTLVATGSTVTIVDENTVALGAIIASALDVTAGTGVTNTGAVVVSGLSDITATTGDIALDFATNDFASIAAATTGGTVDITDSGAGGIVLDAITGSDLIVSAVGNITQTAALSFATASVNSSSGDVTLDNVANDFGIFSGSGATISLNDTNSIDLGATAATTLSVTAANAGDITDSGAIEVTGTSTFTATDNLVTLDFASNDFGTLVATGSTVTVVDENALILGSVTASALNVTAGGNVTQTAALSIADVAVTATGFDVTLNNVGNDFDTAAATGNTVSISDSDELALGAVSSTTLNVNATGNVTDTGALAASGTATINANGGDITLDTAANDFGTLIADGINVTVSDANAIILGAITNATSLNVTAGGNVTQTTALTIADVAVTATGFDVTLNNAGNDFDTLAAAGSNVSVTNTDALALGDVTASTATIIAGGNITDTGTITVSGLGTFTATGNDVTLDTATNNFGTFTATGDNVTVVDQNAINLGDITATNATITAAGNIFDTGILDISGTATFDAAANEVSLDTANNNFGTLIATGTALNIVDEDAIILGDISADSLVVTAAGDITDSGTLNVTGGSTFNAGSNNVTLDTIDNDFGTFRGTANTIIVNDENALDLALITATDATVTAGGNITQATELTIQNLDVSALGFDILLSSNNDFDTLSAVANNVTVNNADSLEITVLDATSANITAGGDITQSAALSMLSVADLSVTATGNDIDLTLLTNEIGTLDAAGANVTVNDTDGIELGTIAASTSFVASTAAGNITRGAGGVITAPTINLNANAGSVVATVDASTISVDAVDANITGNSSFNVDVINIDNDFVLIADTFDIGQTGSGSITANTSNYDAANVTLENAANNVSSFSARVLGNATVVDADGLVLSEVIGANLTATSLTGGIIQNNGQTIDLSGDATLSAASGQVSLGDFDATNLTITAGADVTQQASTALGITGITNINAGANNITLTNIGNDFGTFMGVGAIVDITDMNAIDIGDVTATTSFKVTALSGDITASGIVTTPEATYIASDGLGNFGDVTASTTASILNTTANNVTIANAGNTELTDINTMGDFLITAVGNITQAAGTALLIGGVADFTSSGGNNIILANAGNNFGVLNAAGGMVQVVDSDALTLGTVNATTSFMGSATTGDITNANPAILLTAPTVTLTAAMDAIINVSTALDTLNASAQSVTIVNASGITTDAITAEDLSLTATTGDIAQLQGITVDSLSAFADSVVLDDANNAIGSFSATASTIMLDNTIDIALGNISASTTTISSDGSITQASGTDLNLTGDTNIAAAGMLDLSNANTSLGSVTAMGTDINLRDENDLSLDDVTASVSFTGNATAGDITQTVGVISAPMATLNAPGDVTINTDVAALAITTVSDVSIVEANAIALSSISANSIDLTANGAVTQTGALDIENAAVFNSNSFATTLSNVANDFGTFSATASEVTVVDASGLVLDNVSASSITATAMTGNVTGSVSGMAANLTAAAGDVNVSTDLDSLAAAGTIVTIDEASALELGAISTSSLMLSAAGDVSQTVALDVEQVNVSNGGSNVLLDLANDIGTYTGSSGDINVNVISDIVLSDLSANNLNLTSTGNVSQVTSGSPSDVNVSQSTTINALDITLENDNTSFGTLAATGDDLSFILASGDLVFGNVTAGNSLTAVATLGDIVNPGAQLNASNADLSASGNITVNTLFSALTAIAGGDIDLTNAGAISLTSINTNNLALAAMGDITQTGALTISEDASFTTNAMAAINLDSQSNVFGAVSANGTDVTIVDANGLSLDSITATTFTGRAVLGDITGTVSADAASLTADAGDITVATTVDSLAATGNMVTITETDALVLSGINTNTLNLTAVGEVTQTGDVNASNLNVTLDAAGELLLNNALLSNTIDTVSGSAATIAVSNSADLALAGITADSFELNVMGDVTQSSGTVAVTGTTNIAAEDVTLTNVLNDFTDFLLDANNVQLVDANAIQLGNASANDLTITAVGDVTQLANTALTAANVVVNSQADISLGSLANNITSFTGTGIDITVADANTLILGDITATSFTGQTADGDISFMPNTQVTVDEAIVTATLGGIIIGNTLSIANNLALIAGTDITQQANSTITVAGETSLAAVNATLANAANDFNIVEVAGTITNLTLADANDITLGSISASGNLTVNAIGEITQTVLASGNGAGQTQASDNDSLEVAGTTTLVADSVTLTNSANDFTNLAINAAQQANLVDENGLMLGNVTAAALVADVNGTVGQLTGTSIVVDTASIGANDIVVANANNDFGSISFNANSIDVTDTNAVIIDGMTANAAIVSTGGDLTQTNTSLTVGALSIDAAGANVDLSVNTNDFTSFAATANNITVNDANTLALGNIVATNDTTVVAANALTQMSGTSVSTGNLSVNANSVNLGQVTSSDSILSTSATTTALGNISAANTLTLNSTGAITQTNGTAISAQTVNASAGDIGLGNVTATTALNVDSQGNTTLGNISAASLMVDATGSLTQTTGTVINGASIIIDANSIALSQVTGTGEVSTNSATTTSMGNVNTTGTATFTSGGAFTQSAGSNIQAQDINVTASSAVLAGINAVDTFNVNSTGAVTQLANTTIQGQTISIDANTVNLVNLSAVNAINISALGNVVLGNAVVSGASGALAVTTSGEFSQTSGGNLSAATVGILASAINAANITGETINLTSNSVISLDSITLTPSANATPLTIVALGTSGVIQNGNEASINGLKAPVQIRSFNGTPGSINIVLADTNLVADIRGLSTATPVNSFVATSSDFSQLIAGGALTADNLIDAQGIALSSSTNATSIAVQAGGAAASAGVTSAEVVQVVGEIIDQETTIFRTPEPSIKLPEDQEEEDEFSMFIEAEASTAIAAGNE